MTVTVFTPVYNRIDTIRRLYNSLESQTSKNFEWVVIDDGSTDGSFEELQRIQGAASFEICVEKQTNKGKHAAINRGVLLAKGELFFIVDSDDYLRVDAIETIHNLISTLPKNQKFAGIAGTKVNICGELVGTSFSESYVDCTALERKKHNINGDKSEVFFTEILRQFPFPVFEGENFLTECVVWYRIANAGYMIRWTNEPIYICEYRNDGLSHTTGKCSRNFKGYQLYVKEVLGYKQISIWQRFMELLAYSAIAYKENKDLKACATQIEKPYIFIAIIGRVGFVAYKMKNYVLEKRWKYGK